MNTLAQLLTDFINSYVAGLQIATLQKWVDRLKFLYFTITKMTVKEFIEQLKKLDQNKKIMVAKTYHDYGKNGEPIYVIN